MTLLNASALFAACGLLVPIVIHLHRKRRAKVVEWPAMQFLANTMASRRRGLALENLLLLFVRCLVVLLFVLAMAQPLLPSGRFLPLVASFGLITGGVFGLTVALIRSLSSRTRVVAGIVAGVLLTGAAATLNIDPGDFTSPKQNCDLVIVLDETSSMLMEKQPGERRHQSRFSDAVDEALFLVDQLSGSSTVSIVRCGPVVELVDGSPFRDLPAARKLLSELRPTGGGANTNEAIDPAIALAGKGPSARKQVVLFTDDQLSTWELLEHSHLLRVSTEDVDERDAPNAPEGKKFDDRRVHLAVHLASLPDSIRNVSVVSIRINAPVPTVGQSLLIEAEVRNHGKATITNSDIQLSLDRKPVAVESVDVLPPATTTTIRFPYTFESAGEHVITTQIEFPDAMMDDNRCDTVVSVTPFVSVLLVNGNAFAKRGDQSATFLQLALDPDNRTAVDNDEFHRDRPIRVESVIVAELAQIDSLNVYDVIVLSEVPQLPNDIATRFSKYVKDGGGLWVIPDQQANTKFYNDWKIDDSETAVLPASLMAYQQESVPDAVHNAARTSIDLQAISSAFVSDLIRTGEHDLTEVVVSGYRRVTPRDSAVTGMKLTSGDPLFVEHSVGQGRVLLQTVALGRQESNLPKRVCFPVLMHHWSYYLADCKWGDSNFEPASELSVPVLLDTLTDTEVDSLVLVDPTGKEQAVSVAQHAMGNLVRVRPAGRPGVYSLIRPALPAVSQSFTIARDCRESDLAVISDGKLKALQSAHNIQWINNAEQLRMAGVAELAEHEISPQLLFTVLCLIAAESLLATWIRKRRMVTVAQRPPVPTVPQRWDSTHHAMATVARDELTPALLAGGAE